MVSRVRTQPPAYRESGPLKIYFFGDEYQTTGAGAYTSGLAECTDVVDGTRNDHPLGIRKKEILSITPVNGSNRNPSLVFSASAENYIPYGFRLGGGYQDHADFALPTFEADGTTALARTNPNRPTVSLPLAIAELKDLPGLIKYFWKDLVKGKALRKEYHQSIGDAFMSGIYGIAPMISDAMKLLQFQDEVAKRAAELERLDSSQGLKRRITISQGEKDLNPETYVVDSNAGFFVSYNVKGRTTYERWATVRWKPSQPMPSLLTGKDKYRSLARGTVLGLGGAFAETIKGRSPNGGGYDFWSQASDLWNIMPWSWMVDWFSTAGDFLDANRNSIPVTHGNVCVMEKMETTSVWTRVPGMESWATGGDAVLRYSTKKRAVVGAPTLSASLPFLSGRQLSILGALGLQRLRLRP